MAADNRLTNQHATQTTDQETDLSPPGGIEAAYSTPGTPDLQRQGSQRQGDMWPAGEGQGGLQPQASTTPSATGLQDRQNVDTVIGVAEGLDKDRSSKGMIGDGQEGFSKD